MAVPCKKKSQLLSLLAAILLSANVILPARAAEQTLSTASFDIVYDPAMLNLFGTLSIATNSIFFVPTAFKAESLNGNQLVTANSTVNLRVIPHAEYQIGALTLTERGDYILRGASSFVTVAGQMRAFDLVNPLAEASQFITATGLNIIDGTPHNWQATSFLDLAGDSQLAQSRGINLTLQNLLEAYSDPGDLGAKRAFIEKKFIGISVGLISSVPEPATYAMLLAGLAILALALRRR